MRKKVAVKVQEPVNPESLNYLDVVIDTLKPNRWNPNTESDFIYGKVKKSIEEFKFVDPITARELPQGIYEIIDGEHRWRAAKDLGYKNIPIVNLGKIDDATAQQLTIMLGMRGEDDTSKLVELLKELNDTIGHDRMIDILPYNEFDITSLLELANVQFTEDAESAEEKAKKEKESAEEDDDWVTMFFRIPKTVVDVVESEIDRIGSTLDLKTTLSEDVKRGLILEAICANSASTPIKSIK